MISPEVIDFGVPRNSLLQLRTMEKDKLLERLSLEDLGTTHFHGITAFIPSETVPTEVQECMRDASYYLVKNFPVFKLMESDFLSAFVRKGHLNARTVGSGWFEVDENVIVENGKLLLSVGKDTYQELGLKGQPELILSKHGAAKYCVTIDLLDDKLMIDTKYYQRILWCLEKHIDLQSVDWIMTWIPDADLDICPSSIAAYLDALGYKVVQCNPTLIEASLTDARAPLFSPETDISDVIEWIGAAALNIKCSDQENYTSSFCCPEPNNISKMVHILKWSGFFSVSVVNALLSVMLQIISSEGTDKASSLPWLNLTLHGFEEFQNVNSIYSVFINPANCQIFTSRTTRKKVK